MNLLKKIWNWFTQPWVTPIDDDTNDKCQDCSGCKCKGNDSGNDVW